MEQGENKVGLHCTYIGVNYKLWRKKSMFVGLCYFSTLVICQD